MAGEKNIDTIVEGTLKVAATAALFAGATYLLYIANNEIKNLKTLNNELVPGMDKRPSSDYTTLDCYFHH